MKRSRWQAFPRGMGVGLKMLTCEQSPLALRAGLLFLGHRVRPRATTLKTNSSKPTVGNRLALLTIRLTLSVCTCP